MRLNAIAIEGFRGFVDRAEIDLAADVIILHGPNGVGKTSLLDAVLWALTGRIERFADKGGPVSLYAREGIARVELTLAAKDGHAVVIRASDGQRDTIRLRHAGEESDGAVAESRLADLLLPHVKDRIAAPTALSNVLTRAVYLQQDLVRQFVETDTPAERFSLLSEVIGAGVVLELQQALEKSRNQWSRSTTAFRKEKLDPLKSRLDQVTEQLARLDADGAIENIDARAASEVVFRQAVRLIGQNRVSLSEPPTTSTSLDRLLREIAAERSRIERELATTLSLSEETSILAESPNHRQSEIDQLQRREPALEAKLAELDRSVADNLSALTLRRQRQVVDANRLNRAATLATLALENLGDICPVCQQTHDVSKTKAHLHSLIAASATVPDDTRPAEKEVEQLNSRRTQARVEITELRSQLRDLQRAQNEISTRQSILRARLNEIGISDEADPLDGLDSRRQALETALAALADLLRSGERLTLTVVRMGEQRRRAELSREKDSLQKKVAEVTRQLEEQDNTHTLAGRIIDALRGASLKVTRKQVENVAPLFQRIYSRIDPHPTFRVTQILTSMERGKGQLMVGVSDPEQGEDAHEAVPILSSSQLNSFAASLFLALNLALPSLKLGVTILDDPLQSLDSINLLGLVDVLRRFTAHRQIIVSTHEARLLGLLQRKLRPVRAGERMITLMFEDWTRTGPNFRTVPLSYDGVEETVLAA
jgi:DNA repair exonuclease SbcCD ATPase subunit